MTQAVKFNCLQKTCNLKSKQRSLNSVYLWRNNKCLKKDNALLTPTHFILCGLRPLYKLVNTTEWLNVQVVIFVFIFLSNYCYPKMKSVAFIVLLWLQGYEVFFVVQNIKLMLFYNLAITCHCRLCRLQLPRDPRASNQKQAKSVIRDCDSVSNCFTIVFNESVKFKDFRY